MGGEAFLAASLAGTDCAGCVWHRGWAGKTAVPNCVCRNRKKNGKSELAAAVALYLLYADDEPSAEVYGAAADRQQASIVFDVANQMVQMTPALLKRSKIMALPSGL